MRLRTKGFKGTDHDLELDKLNLVQGPNGTGKSGMADAIRFLALGHVPALGKRHQDVAALMSGRHMEVELILPDGRYMRRSLEQTGSGLKREDECSWLKNAKPSEHDKAIVAMFGAEEADASEILDIRTLLSAPASQRARRIEDLLSAGAADPERVVDRVAALTVSRITKQTLDGIDGWRTLLPIIKDRHREILKQQVSGPLPARIQEDGIGAACKWANEKKRKADADLKTARAAAKEFDARMQEIPENLEATTKDAQDLRDRLQREMGAARSRAETRADDKSRLERDTQRAEELRSDIKAYTEKFDKATLAGGLSAEEVESVKLAIADIWEQAKECQASETLLRDSAEQVREGLVPHPDTRETEIALDKSKAMLESAQSDGWSRVGEIGLALSSYKQKRISAHGFDRFEVLKTAGEMFPKSLEV